MIAIIILIVVVILILASCIKIVPQANAYVVERLGAYQGTWEVGIHFKMPIIDRVAKRVLLKEQVVDFAPQPVITKDNVTMRIDTVVFFQITDPKLFSYGVENPIMAIENLTATTLRYVRLPSRYISRYKLLFPFASSFIRRRIGSLTFAGFFTRCIAPPLLLVISATKVRRTIRIKEQIRNKNVPKKNQTSANTENK